jgi:hypothetical protein
MGQSHRELIVWHKAMDLAEAVYGLAGNLFSIPYSLLSGTKEPNNVRNIS